MNIPENLSNWQIGAFWLEGLNRAMRVASLFPSCYGGGIADRNPDPTANKGAGRMERAQAASGLTTSNTDRGGLAPPTGWRRLLA